MTKPLFKNEVFERTGRFQQKLQSAGIAGALIVEKTDLYYLSGTKQDGHLFVPADGPPVLMVRRDFERALSESPLDKIVPIKSLSDVPPLIKEVHQPPLERLGLEMDVLPAKRYFLYRKFFPECEPVDISGLIRETRMIKSDYEMDRIRKASQMADGMYERVPEFLKTAETEIELSIMVEAYYRRRGHPGFIPTRGFNFDAIYGHIMGGEAAAMPSASPGPTGGAGLGPYFSQGAGWGKLKPNTPILIDYCAGFDGYAFDSTRIFSMGALSPKLVRAHGVMLEVQETLMGLGTPGTRAGDLYEAAMNIVEREGLTKGFMGYPEGVPFVGHGVGLELDEWPVIGKGSNTILEKKMVIAMEPKMVFPGEGVVGIENTLLVTPGGLEKINGFPDDIRIC